MASETMTRALKIRLERSLAIKLETEAEKMHVPVSHIVRQAIRLYFEEKESENGETGNQSEAS